MLSLDPPSFRKIPISIQILFQRANELGEQCEYFIRDCDDPLVISTAYVEKVVLRRHDADTQWVSGGGGF